jgi:hypothetical protein
MAFGFHKSIMTALGEALKVLPLRAIQREYGRGEGGSSAMSILLTLLAPLSGGDLRGISTKLKCR